MTQPTIATLRRSTRPWKARIIREVEPLTARARSPPQVENAPQRRSNEETPAEGSALYDNDQVYRELANEEDAEHEEVGNEEAHEDAQPDEDFDPPLRIPPP